MSCYKIRMHCNLCSRANYLPSRRRVLSLSTPSAPALIPPPLHGAVSNVSISAVVTSHMNDHAKQAVQQLQNVAYMPIK